MTDSDATSPDRLSPAPNTASIPALGSNAGFWSLVIVGVVVLVYVATWISVGRGAAEHQLVVALAVPWLLWRRRARLLERPIEPAPWLLPVVLGLSAIWLVSERAVIYSGVVALWPLLALATVWAGAGRSAARTLAFPFLFLYAALPLWSGLMGPLQSLASVAVSGVADLVGLQVIVQGNYILLPRDTIYIADRCSGVNYLTVALAIGALVGEVRSDRWPMRILIVLLCSAISILFNWIRILLISGAYLDPGLRHYLEVVGHENPGWWIFAAGLVIFFAIVHFLPHSSPSSRPVAPSIPSRQQHSAAGPLLAILAVAFLPFMSWALTRDRELPPVPTGPPQIEGLTGPIPPSSQWQANYQGATWEHRAAYIGSSQQVLEVYRNGFHDQSEDRELGSVETRLFAMSQLTARATEIRKVSAGTARVSVNRSHLVSPTGAHWVSYHVYLLDGRPIADYRQTKILTGLRASMGHPVAGVLALAAPCVPDCTQVDQPLAELLVSLLVAYGDIRP